MYIGSNFGREKLKKNLFTKSKYKRYSSNLLKKHAETCVFPGFLGWGDYTPAQIFVLIKYNMPYNKIIYENCCSSFY